MCHNHYADGDIDASADRRQTNAELFKVNIMLTAVKLPSNFTIQSGRIYKNLNSKTGGWELFSNGAFQVSSAYMCHGSKEVFLTVRFEDADGNHTDEITLSQTDLVRSGNGLLRLVPSWLVFYTPRLADQVDFIRSAINLQRADLPIRTVFRVGPGYHTAPDGKTLFYVLGPSDPRSKMHRAGNRFLPSSSQISSRKTERGNPVGTAILWAGAATGRTIRGDTHGLCPSAARVARNKLHLCHLRGRRIGDWKERERQALVFDFPGAAWSHLVQR